MLDLGIAAPVQLHMSSGLRDGFQPEQPRTIATTTPTRLAGWIRDELAPVPLREYLVDMSDKSLMDSTCAWDSK